MMPKHLALRRSRGLTLVELLVAIALGMVVLTALVALYANVARTNSEMTKTNLLIENGRFAMQLLQDDVALAGFWGPLDTIEATSVPDPCLAHAAWPTDATQLEAYKTNLVAHPAPRPCQWQRSGSLWRRPGERAGAKRRADRAPRQHLHRRCQLRRWQRHGAAYPGVRLQDCGAAGASLGAGVQGRTRRARRGIAFDQDPS